MFQGFETELLALLGCLLVWLWRGRVGRRDNAVEFELTASLFVGVEGVFVKNYEPSQSEARVDKAKNDQDDTDDKEDVGEDGFDGSFFHRSIVAVL